MGCSSSSSVAVEDTTTLQTNSLVCIPFFADLTPKGVRLLVKEFTRSAVKAGEVIKQKNAVDDRFYVVVSGKLKLLGNSETQGRVLIAEYAAGEWFGEVVLCESQMSSLEVEAAEDSIFFSIDCASFKKFLADNPECQTVLVEDFHPDGVQVVLRSIPIFSQISELKLQQLSRILEFKRLTANKNLWNEGDPSDGLNIVVRGSLAVFGKNMSGEEVALEVLGSRDWFGETSLLDDVPRLSTIRCVSDVVLLHLNRSKFQKFLALAFENQAQRDAFSVLIQQRTANMLKTIPFFSMLHTKQVGGLQRFDEKKLGLLSQMFTFETFGKDQVVIREGEEGTFLYVIVKGSCSVHALGVDGDLIQFETMKPGQLIGEIALLESLPRTATVSTLEDCVFLKLTANKFQMFLSIAPELKSSVEFMVKFKKTKYIEKIPMFSKIKEGGKPWSKLGLMGELFEYAFYKEKDTVLIQEGDIADKFFVIISGSVKLFQSEYSKFLVDRHSVLIKSKLELPDKHLFHSQTPENESAGSFHADSSTPNSATPSPRFNEHERDPSQSRLSVAAGKKYSVILTSGDCFGEIALLGFDEINFRTASAVVNEPCLVLYLTKDRFKTFLHVVPEMRKKLVTKSMKAMAEVPEEELSFVPSPKASYVEAIDAISEMEPMESTDFLRSNSKNSRADNYAVEPAAASVKITRAATHAVENSLTVPSMASPIKISRAASQAVENIPVIKITKADNDPSS